MYHVYPHIAIKANRQRVCSKKKSHVNLNGYIEANVNGQMITHQ